MFAYSLNNPVNYRDDAGESAILITLGIMVVGGLIGTGISAASSAITQQVLTGEINWRSVGVAAASGFVSGAFAASPLGLPWQMFIGGAIGGLSYVTDCFVNNSQITLDGAAMSIAMGILSGRVGGPGANQNYTLTNTILSLKRSVLREGRRANQKYAQKAIMSLATYVNNIFAEIVLDSSVLFAAGCGIANAINTMYSNHKTFMVWPSGVLKEA